MLYFDGGELEKKSGFKKNCDRWCDKVVVILPLTEILISKLGMLQKILAIIVLWFLCILIVCNIWSWSDDDVILSINSLYVVKYQSLRDWC